MAGLGDILDAIAIKALADLSAADPVTGLPGLKACYGPNTSGLGAVLYPLTTEDTPVGYVMPAGGDATASNYELYLHQIELRILSIAADVSFAMRVLVPFVQRCRESFRSDIDAAGTAARVLMTGYGEPEHDEDNGRHYLVLPIRLEALELTVGGSLYST